MTSADAYRFVWLRDLCERAGKGVLPSNVDARCVLGCITDLAARAEAAEAESARLREWRDSVSSAIKTLPEFHSGQWGGNKEGWGYHFEVVRWMVRTLAERDDANP